MTLNPEHRYLRGLPLCGCGKPTYGKEPRTHRPRCSDCAQREKRRAVTQKLRRR
jgi:hypothetical protein